MSVTIEDVNAAQQQLVDDTAIIHQMVHGDDNTTITVETGTIRSLLKLQKDFLAQYAAPIINATLTGLSLASTAAATATDSILAAIGKLQAQLNQLATRANTVEYHAFVPGKPTAGATVMFIKAARPFVIPVNFAGSQMESKTAAQVGATFNVYKNASLVGTLTFNAAANVPVFAAASAANFAVGDKLSVTTPSPQDSTLADVTLTLVVTLT